MRWLPHCLSDDRKHRYMVSGRNAKRVMEPLEKMHLLPHLDNLLEAWEMLILFILILNSTLWYLFP